MFTCQTLRRRANDNSFRRGEAPCDDGNVTKLRRENDAFRATVRGSRSYHVALRLAAAGPEFTCNCSYEFDGICKHAVAWAWRCSMPTAPTWPARSQPPAPLPVRPPRPTASPT